MELTEQLKEIKTQLRLSMNGAVSQSMREKGLCENKGAKDMKCFFGMRIAS